MRRTNKLGPETARHRTANFLLNFLAAGLWLARWLVRGLRSVSRLPKGRC